VTDAKTIERQKSESKIPEKQRVEDDKARKNEPGQKPRKSGVNLPKKKLTHEELLKMMREQQ